MSAPKAKGKVHVKSHLDAVLSTSDHQTTKMYALGLIEGAAEWLAKYYTEPSVYESVSRVADHIIDPNLPKGK